jgi:hypothetical protein
MNKDVTIEVIDLNNDAWDDDDDDQRPTLPMIAPPTPTDPPPDEPLEDISA